MINECTRCAPWTGPRDAGPTQNTHDVGVYYSLVRGTQIVQMVTTGLLGDRFTRIQDLPESLGEPCPVEHSRKRIPQGKAEGKTRTKRVPLRHSK